MFIETERTKCQKKEQEWRRKQENHGNHDEKHRKTRTTKKQEQHREAKSFEIFNQDQKSTTIYGILQREPYKRGREKGGTQQAPEKSLSQKTKSTQQFVRGIKKDQEWKITKNIPRKRW